MRIQSLRHVAYTACIMMAIGHAKSQSGSLDPSFVPWEGLAGVSPMALQSDGKLLVAAGVDAFTYAFRRLNVDGSLDDSFQTDDIQCCVGAVALQPDEKVLFGGLYCTGGLCTIDRLDPDGSFDPSFDPGIGANDYVWAIAVQPDEKVLIGGRFTTYNGIARDGIARLNNDGSLDTSFDPGEGVTGSAYGLVNAIVIQPDGKILIGGTFTYYDGVAINSFARLNSNGTIDQTFDPGDGVGFTSVTSIALQTDGKILLGGSFATYDGAPSLRVARVNSDGSSDGTFTSELPVDSYIFYVHAQQDGKILIGGQFETYGGVARKNIARLQPNGALDLSFDPGSGADGSVANMILQPDGRLLIGGGFTSYNGTPRNHVARLLNDIGTGMPEEAVESQFGFTVQPNPTDGSFQIQLPYHAHDVQIEISDVAGRKVLHKNFYDTLLVQLQLDAPCGLYVLSIYSDGKKTTSKLLKN